MSHKYFTINERIKLEVLLKENYKISEIAKILNRHRATIYREIKRINGEYSSENAQADANAKAANKGRNSKITSELKNLIEDRLCKTWSPEQIIGRELKEFISLKSSYVKEFYRRMKQFKSTGKWNISLEDFKRIMDVPVNYRMCDIDVWVLKPIQKELEDKFKLKVKKIYSKKSRGRPSVSGFEFTFSKEKYQAKETSKTKNRKEIKTPADFFIHRKVRMMDGVTRIFNTLTIKSINEQKNGMVVVKIQNVDDFYEQEFAFNSMEHFENWFRKYVI
ncbi:RepB family plasmid replication initiator protein [Leptotrichia wadei]|uniref:helix-turn-helix domain-containing protein n=1 Tax=Leptotrichia wadei TaxID=157687 RepID=UPI00352EBFD0